MADKIEYSRLLVKRTTDSGIFPSVPTGSTLNTFTDTDTFVGEFFLNSVDNQLWIRTNSGQVPVFLSGNTGFTTDYFVTGATYSAGTITFYNNNGSNFGVNVGSLAFSGGSGNCITDLYVTNLYGCSPVQLHNNMVMREDVDTPGQGTQLQSFSGNSFIAFDKGYIQEGLFLQSSDPNVAGTYGTFDVTPADISASIAVGGLSQANLQLKDNRSIVIDVDNLTGSTQTQINLNELNTNIYIGNNYGDFSTSNFNDTHMSFEVGVGISGNTAAFLLDPNNIIGGNKFYTSDLVSNQTLIEYTPTNINLGYTNTTASTITDINIEEGRIRLTAEKVPLYGSELQLRDDETTWNLETSAITASVGMDINDLVLSYTDNIDTSTITLNPTDITIDTLNVFVNNLPTSSSGLTSNQLYTQTSTELGGSGSTKVICIV